MKKIVVNTWERVQLGVIVGSQRGNVEAIAICLELRSKLLLTPDEKAKVGFVEFTDGSVQWKDANYEFELEFEDTNFKFLAERVENWNDWPVHDSVVPLVAKFKED